MHKHRDVVPKYSCSALTYWGSNTEQPLKTLQAFNVWTLSPRVFPSCIPCLCLLPASPTPNVSVCVPSCSAPFWFICAAHQSQSILEISTFAKTRVGMQSRCVLLLARYSGSNGCYLAASNKEAALARWQLKAKRGLFLGRPWSVLSYAFAVGVSAVGSAGCGWGNQAQPLLGRRCSGGRPPGGAVTPRNRGSGRPCPLPDRASGNWKISPKNHSVTFYRQTKGLNSSSFCWDG